MWLIDTTKYILSPYGIFLSLSFVVGLTVAAVYLYRRKVSKTTVVLSVMINATLTVYLGFVFTIVVNMATGKKSFGFTSSGGALGMIIGAFIVFAVTKNLEIIKGYSLVIPLMYSISKLGCFAVGCCGGIEYHGIASVKYIGEGEWIHDYPTFPVQLLETIVFLLIFIVLVLLRKLEYKKHISINVILCAFAKFALDFTREAHVGHILTVNQISCIVLVALVMILTFVIIPIIRENFS